MKKFFIATIIFCACFILYKNYDNGFIDYEYLTHTSIEDKDYARMIYNLDKQKEICLSFGFFQLFYIEDFHLQRCKNLKLALKIIEEKGLLNKIKTKGISEIEADFVEEVIDSYAVLPIYN